MELTEDQVFDLVRRHLLRTRGIDLSGYSRPFIMRGIRKTMGRADVGNYSTYIKLLRVSEEETNRLLGALSINVTDFFRDRSAFDSFATKVIRPVLAAKCATRGGIMRIWSAGCATGQEAYTLAMCIAQEMARLKSGNRALTMVVGTDISTKALSKAREGIYTRDQVRGVPEAWLRDYFERDGGNYRVCDSLRRGVRFTRENLLDPPTSKYFDAIVCRNVVIYFSRPMHETVMANLHDALRMGGHLMLGRTETLMGDFRRKFEVVDPENRIFRKVG